MNSLVVLFSLVALAAAKPSGLLHSEILSYAAPAITLPAAVSSQSRIDIKSSPAVVATAAVAPIARTVIAEPALIAPAIAPAAVSHQSRIDIKSSPAIISSVITPTIVKTAIAPTLVKTIAAPIIAAPAIKAYSVLKTAYDSPIFAAPAAIAAHAELEPSVPLDTPEVIAARAAHFEAKALAGAHFIHKRSAPLIAAPALTYAASPLISTYAATPLIHTAPLAYSGLIHTPLINKAYSVHPW